MPPWERGPSGGLCPLAEALGGGLGRSFGGVKEAGAGDPTHDTIAKISQSLAKHPCKK